MFGTDLSRACFDSDMSRLHAGSFDVLQAAGRRLGYYDWTLSPFIPRQSESHNVLSPLDMKSGVFFCCGRFSLSTRVSGLPPVLGAVYMAALSLPPDLALW